MFVCLLAFLKKEKKKEGKDLKTEISKILAVVFPDLSLSLFLLFFDYVL